MTGINVSDHINDHSVIVHTTAVKVQSWRNLRISVRANAARYIGGVRDEMPPGLPPAPPVDPGEFHVPARDWGYWTVALPCVLMFFWAILIALGGLVAGTIGSDGVTGPDPARAAAVNDYENGQLIAIAAVVILLLTGAVALSRHRRPIALTACGIFLLDIGCLFLA
jgi:hypothetical protein